MLVRNNSSSVDETPFPRVLFIILSSRENPSSPAISSTAWSTRQPFNHPPIKLKDISSIGALFITSRSRPRSVRIRPGGLSRFAWVSHSWAVPEQSRNLLLGSDAAAVSRGEGLEAERLRGGRACEVCPPLLTTLSAWSGPSSIDEANVDRFAARSKLNDGDRLFNCLPFRLALVSRFRWLSAQMTQPSPTGQQELILSKWRASRPQ